MYKRAICPFNISHIKIYGLYGQTETGFIGLNTPKCKQNQYHLLTEHFFVEITNSGEVLVTDLTKPIVPLFRYYVGDLGELITEDCTCGMKHPILLLKGRSDKKFNFMGNLIGYKRIKQEIIAIYEKDIDIQLQLSTNKNGVDVLNVVVDDDELSILKFQHLIEQKLNAIGEIREGIEKGTGMLKISSNKDLIFSTRQKMPYIHDMR